LPGEFVPPPPAVDGPDRGPSPPSSDERPAIPLRERSYAEVTRGPVSELSAAEYVYVRRGGSSNPMQPPYDGPYKVLHRRSKVYTLQVGSREEDVAVDRLKPHAGAEPAAVGQPPRRGRPPGTGGQAATASSGAGVLGGPCGACKIRERFSN
jgi:hypothetical protein